MIRVLHIEIIIHRYCIERKEEQSEFASYKFFCSSFEAIIIDTWL
jgi:hypothetical protein